jgi:hypothetical protein
MKFLRHVIVSITFSSVLVGQSMLQADDPTGRWGGSWCSFTNGHHGKINARICQVDNGTYNVRFCGTFAGVVPFTYSVPMCVTGQSADGRTYLSGQSHLPFFGDFCCQAEVTTCDFVASYTSSKDQGQFVMQRR